MVMNESHCLNCIRTAHKFWQLAILQQYTVFLKIPAKLVWLQQCVQHSKWGKHYRRHAYFAGIFKKTVYCCKVGSCQNMCVRNAVENFTLNLNEIVFLVYEMETPALHVSSHKCWSRWLILTFKGYKKEYKDIQMVQNKIWVS